MHIVSDDIRLYYDTAGDGLPVVLLHPFPVHHKFWSPVVNRLGSRYRLVLPDLRAHGSSEVGNGTATMAKHADDLLRLLDAERIQRAVFVGVSIGGYILFEFWRKHRERIAALVLANTRAEPDTAQGRVNRLKSISDSERQGAAPFLDAQIEHLVGATTRRNRPDLAAQARAMMNGLSLDGLRALQNGMAERPDSLPTLRSIAVPTLIIAGEEDTLTPAAHAHLMHEHIARSKLKIIPAVGHYAALENPEEFTRALSQFLETVEVRSL